MEQTDSALRPPLGYRLQQVTRRLGLRPRLRLRVPAAFVTGSVGKTTTCSMVAAILAAAGHHVGLATSTGCFVGGRRVRRGDSSRPKWAAALAADRSITAGVFETARGGLLLDGFPFQGRTVGAVLNVHDNHLGLGGVATHEQLAAVKSAVVAGATDLAVLNADDARCLTMRSCTRAAAICLVGRDGGGGAIREHLAGGGMAAFLDPGAGAAGDHLRLRHGERDVVSLPADTIPASHGGLFEPVVINALFAMAVAHGLGADADAIRRGLAAFHSDPEDNPGRMNYHRDLPYTLVATKADGRRAAEALTRFVAGLDVPGRKMLIVTDVGDRSDEWLRGMGRAFAPGFDRFVCCDWEHPRGRPPGQTAARLAEGLAAAGVAPHAITVEKEHDAALRSGCATASHGDLVVIVSPTSWRIREILGPSDAAACPATKEAA